MDKQEYEQAVDDILTRLNNNKNTYDDLLNVLSTALAVVAYNAAEENEDTALAIAREQNEHIIEKIQILHGMRIRRMVN